MKLILFDLNGTLINDNEIWLASMEAVFHAYKKIPPTVEEYFLAMEGDWAEVYRSRGIEASPDELNAIYIPCFTNLIHKTELFPDVFYTLSTLKYVGFHVGFITGNPEELITPVLSKLGIDKFFTKEFSRAHDRNKHKTIEEFVAKSGVTKENCFYVGDSPSDISHGNKANIQTVAFLNGFIPEYLVLGKKPTHSIRKIIELVEIV